jgi:hypothetical protein
LFQFFQGKDIVSGPAPAIGRELKEVGGHLLGDDRRLPEKLLMMFEKKRVAHLSVL